MRGFDITPEQAEAHNKRVRARRAGQVISLPSVVEKRQPQGKEEMVLKLEVGLPPSPNNCYANVFGAGRVMTLAGRKYKAEVESLAQVRANQQGFFYPDNARLSLSITAHFRNNKRRDLSNLIKLIEDALATALGFDDKVVDKLTVERGPRAEGEPAYCEVILSVIGGF